VLGEYLAQIGAEALVFSSSPTGQLGVNLGRKVFDQDVYADTISFWIVPVVAVMDGVVWS
jgi:hypothetical protein